MAAATTLIEMPAEEHTNRHISLDNSNGSIHLPDGSASNHVPLEPFGQGTGLVVDALERWDRPRINTYRLAAIFFAFLIFGMNDGSYGALVPYVRPKLASWAFPNSFSGF